MLYTPLLFLDEEEDDNANAPRDNAQMNPTLFPELEIFPRLVFNGVEVFSSSNKERRSPFTSSLFNSIVEPIVFMMMRCVGLCVCSLSQKAIDLSVI